MALLAAVTFVVCCLRSFVPPHTPLLLWGDQLGYATKGVRILGGELPYRDFFEFLTPGTDLVYALLFRCFGITMWVPNLTMAALAAVATLGITWSARRIMQGWFAVLPALLLLGFVLFGSLDATHHWFSTIAVMAAVSLLCQRTTLVRVAAAGALCGIAASFTQSKGAAIVAGLFVYLLWSSRLEPSRAGNHLRRALTLCLVLLLAATLVFAAINGRFILAAGIRPWAHDVIVYPLRYFGRVDTNNWRGAGLEWRERSGVLKWICSPFLYLSVPLTYLWFFAEWSFSKDRSRSTQTPIAFNPQRRQLLLLAIAGSAMLAAVSPALSIRRISCVSPPAMVLLAWLLSRRGPSGLTCAKLLGAVSVVIAAGQVVAVQTHPKHLVTLPVGTVAIPSADNAELYRWMAENTHPGQWYFGLPPLTLPLELRNPTPIESPGPAGYSRPDQIAAVVQGLERTQTPMLILRRSPRTQADKDDNLQPFFDYVDAHYQKTRRFAPGDEVWQRVR